MTPILHLHGCVGWYRRPGGEVFDAGDAPHYSKDFGDPVVMLPNPVKNYSADLLIDSMWGQFELALSRARHVLVVGHSLNDAAIVSALKHVEDQTRIGVALLADESDPTQTTLAGHVTQDIMTRELPQAVAINMRLGQLTDTARRGLRKWKAG